MLAVDLACVSCLIFIAGLCECFQRAGGARARQDCETCRCVTVRAYQNGLRKTRRLFFHTKKGVTCGCELLCGKGANEGGRCSVKNSTALIPHDYCVNNLWRQCEHMKKVQEQVEKVLKSNLRFVLPNCIPCIGTKSRNYILDGEAAAGDPRNFIQERQEVITQYRKKKYQLEIREAHLENVTLSQPHCDEETHTPLNNPTISEIENAVIVSPVVADEEKNVPHEDGLEALPGDDEDPANDPLELEQSESEASSNTSIIGNWVATSLSSDRGGKNAATCKNKQAQKRYRKEEQSLSTPKFQKRNTDQKRKTDLRSAGPDTAAAAASTATGAGTGGGAGAGAGAGAAKVVSPTLGTTTTTQTYMQEYRAVSTQTDLGAKTLSSCSLTTTKTTQTALREKKLTLATTQTDLQTTLTKTDATQNLIWTQCARSRWTQTNPVETESSQRARPQQVSYPNKIHYHIIRH